MDPEVIKNIWHPDEPTIYNRKEITGLHTLARTSQKLNYKKYSKRELAEHLSYEDRNKLIDAGAYDNYEYFRNHYINSTHLSIGSLDASYRPMQQPDLKIMTM